MKKKKAAKVFGFIFGQGVLFLLVLLTFSLHWSFKNFGNIGLNEIIFTLNMPLKEASAGFVADYFRKAFFSGGRDFCSRIAAGSVSV